MFVKHQEIPSLMVVSNTIIVLHITYIPQCTQCDESTSRWRLLKETNTLKGASSLKFQTSQLTIILHYLRFIYKRVGKYQGYLQNTDANWMWKHLFCDWFFGILLDHFTKVCRSLSRNFFLQCNIPKCTILHKHFVHYSMSRVKQSS